MENTEYMRATCGVGKNDVVARGGAHFSGAAPSSILLERLPRRLCLILLPAGNYELAGSLASSIPSLKHPPPRVIIRQHIEFLRGLWEVAVPLGHCRRTEVRCRFG